MIEIDRPARPARRNGAKTDELDAVRAAREALARPHLAEPRAAGYREALRVLLATRQAAVQATTGAISALHALIVAAPDDVRSRLRDLSGVTMLRTCAALRVRQDHPADRAAIIATIRSTARRALCLRREADEHKERIEHLVRQMAPRLFDQPGVGPITAAIVLCAWSHPGGSATRPPSPTWPVSLPSPRRPG